MSQTNNPNDLEENWNYWYPRVYGYFYKRVDQKTEVEDLTANTMNTAFTAQNVLNFQAYIWRVAHNYLVKYINTKNTDPTPISFNEDWMSGEFQEKEENIISDHYTDKIKQLMECVQNNINPIICNRGKKQH
jgi:DNA-directed RNA polymerase specialized sigma24 family protein